MVECYEHRLPKTNWFFVNSEIKCIIFMECHRKNLGKVSNLRDFYYLSMPYSWVLEEKLHANDLRILNLWSIFVLRVVFMGFPLSPPLCTSVAFSCFRIQFLNLSPQTSAHPAGQSRQRFSLFWQSQKLSVVVSIHSNILSLPRENSETYWIGH